MKEEKDKFDDMLDWIEPGKELTDEELASLMQDREAMSDYKDVMDAQQATNRHAAQEEGLPFDLDQEWAKVASFIDDNSEVKQEDEAGNSEDKDDAIIRELPKKHFSKALYIIIGVAAALLLVFVLDRILTPSAPTTADPQNSAYVFQRDTTAAPVAILTSSDNSQAPQILNGEGIIVPKNQQQPATSTTARILHALGFEKDNVAMQNNTITLPPGKSYNITLADGTKVFMYAGSRLTYPIAFSGKERRVYLEGEAYFKVTKDKQHPFIITTDKAEAKVLGTELNVSCYKGEPCHVALLTGSVMVSNKQAARSIKLVPGQGVTVSESAPFSLSSESMDTYSYWLSGYIYFDDTSLAEIAKSIGRWYNVNVVFSNEALKNIKLRYFCQRSEPIERAVELLNSYGRFKASIEGETLHIK